MRSSVFSGRDQLRERQPGRQYLALEVRDVLRFDQLMIDGGDRVLPDQIFLRNVGAEIARARTHVAVRQLEPGPCECVRELIRILEEAP